MTRTHVRRATDFDGSERGSVPAIDEEGYDNVA
jgi:hypothetical protein